ncbi:MAG: class I SAM-dependent methyltransferase [Actinomycetota bacterium]
MAGQPSLSPRVKHARELFAGVAREYDLMSEVLSFGTHRRWRRFLVSRVRVPSDALVLDVATGTAGVAIALAHATGARAVGLDQSPEMLAVGGRRVAAARLAGRITLLEGRAERLPFPDETFDALTFTFLLRYVDDVPAVVSELARVLRPGGVMASLEFSIPRNPLARAGWYVQTRVGLPALGRVASRAWFDTGRFLGPSIADFYRRLPLGEQLEIWRGAGMRDVRPKLLTLGSGVVTWGIKDG